MKDTREEKSQELKTAAITADLLNAILKDPMSEGFLKGNLSPTTTQTVHVGISIQKITQEEGEILKKAAELSRLYYEPNLPIAKGKTGGFTNQRLETDLN